MTKPVYASALALLLFTSVGLPNTSSSPINVETNVTHQSFSEEAALREAAELIRQSQFGGESLGAAEIGLARLYKEHRDSRIAELLAALLDGAHEKRAEQDLCIAMYYMYKQSNYPAAEHRLKLIETGRAAEAEKTLQGLLARFGCSARARDAQEKLESLRSGK
jgi:hypothetical protein